MLDYSYCYLSLALALSTLSVSSCTSSSHAHSIMVSCVFFLVSCSFLSLSILSPDNHWGMFLYTYTTSYVIYQCSLADIGLGKYDLLWFVSLPMISSCSLFIVKLISCLVCSLIFGHIVYFSLTLLMLLLLNYNLTPFCFLITGREFSYYSFMLTTRLLSLDSLRHSSQFYHISYVFLITYHFDLFHYLWQLCVPWYKYCSWLHVLLLHFWSVQSSVLLSPKQSALTLALQTSFDLIFSLIVIQGSCVSLWVPPLRQHCSATTYVQWLKKVSQCLHAFH